MKKLGYVVFVAKMYEIMTAQKLAHFVVNIYERMEVKARTEGGYGTPNQAKDEKR